MRSLCCSDALVLSVKGATCLYFFVVKLSCCRHKACVEEILLNCPCKVSCVCGEALMLSTQGHGEVSTGSSESFTVKGSSTHR